MLSTPTKSLSEKVADLSETAVISTLAKWATNNKLPFVVYRLPKQDHFHFLIGSSAINLDNRDLASMGVGFLISSYEGEQFFIDRAISYSSKNGDLVEYDKLPSHILTETIRESAEGWVPYYSENTNKQTSSEEYIEDVSRCIREINNSDLLKVVPSKIKRVKLPSTTNYADTFLKLCTAYSNTFVSILSIPEIGTWVGATPETLIELGSNGIFKTMSLAGTQQHKDSQPLHTLPWTEKEIEEQAIVSRYIINRFKEIRVREFEEVGPKTTQAGNLAHLCSTFTVDTVANDYPDLASTMLELLHPTSAVCGMPKPLAQQLISSIEKHPRKLYSGYIGPVNMAEGSYIYVNLRCMEVLEEEAVFYAGAGITAYSDPEDEWLETELKCNTLLNIIQG